MMRDQRRDAEYSKTMSVEYSALAGVGAGTLIGKASQRATQPAIFQPNRLSAILTLSLLREGNVVRRG